MCGPEAAIEFERYCGWLDAFIGSRCRSFLARNYDGPLDLVRPLARPCSCSPLGGVGRLDRRVRRAFTDERLQRLFSFQALYAGVAPQQALAMLAVITYMDVGRRRLVPRPAASMPSPLAWRRRPTRAASASISACQPSA